MGGIQNLNRLGQSVWLDFIDRGSIASGELKALIDQVGISGVTSNPSIFEKTIDGTDHYENAISELIDCGIGDVKSIYESLAIRDIQDTADLLREHYNLSNFRDGYVSIEVSPDLATDAEGTILEARRLWELVARPNVMIKVPGTTECIPAIKELLSEGINVNITLLFSRDRYQSVLDAFADGIEKLSAEKDISRVASVASFFVSRIDTLADRLLFEKIEKESDEAAKAALRALVGQIAIANAKLAYQQYLQFLKSTRWKKLAEMGAQTQKLLWASTSTKNPEYRDVLYIESLIGKDTVTTVPIKTLKAFQDHGIARPTILDHVSEARHMIGHLEELGISLEKIADQLLVEGVGSFSDSFERLLAALEKKRRKFSKRPLNAPSFSIPPDLKRDYDSALLDWQNLGNTRKIWSGDSSLWTGKDESKWLGWLSLPSTETLNIDEIEAFSRQVSDSGFTDVLLLGMGGSSLCPAVHSQTFDAKPGSPMLHVLDSTAPDQIHYVETRLNLSKTLFVVSSKSGSTLEPNLLCEYFFGKISSDLKGSAGAGRQFVAITDPGSPLDKLAGEKNFRRVFYGKSDVGGRYSALSNFGIVPSILMGVDIRKLLAQSQTMAYACGPFVPANGNPAVELGLILGRCALTGRNKVTFFCSKKVASFGTWLEQLLAESTGKQGKGLIPITGEPIAPPDAYGDDRLFVSIKVANDQDERVERALSSLIQSGHPVVEINMEDEYGIGQEYFRWEMATAVAGAVLKINPFNQPDVEASKEAARELVEGYEKSGAVKPEAPILDEDGIQVFADGEFQTGASRPKSLVDIMKMEFDEIKRGDYFGILAYLPMNATLADELEKIRVAVRDRKKAATCLEFGPRFLHSTGQMYKGGPNTGVFLEVTADPEHDLAIPGHRATFGVVAMAQARGDFRVLTSERRRRAIRVHMKGDIKKGLSKLNAAAQEALGVRG